MTWRTNFEDQKKLHRLFPTFLYMSRIKQNQTLHPYLISSRFFCLIKWENMNFPQLFCRWADPADFPPSSYRLFWMGILQQKLHLLALYHLRISTRKSRHFHDLRHETPLGNAGKAFPREFPVSMVKENDLCCHKFWKTTIALWIVIIGVKNRVFIESSSFRLFNCGFF